MNVKIITLHHIGNNFGSVLQACALCSFLNQNGYDAALIDYIPPQSILKRVKTAAVNALFFPYYMERRRRFRRYLRTHARMTKRYTSYKKLIDDVPQADVYIAGSDQIWNPHFPCGKDDAYYLKFVPGGNKMAYAASTGRLLDDRELAALRENTRGFRYISFREGAICVQFRGFGIEAAHVLDPVFLVDQQYYLRDMEPNDRGRYLLVYAVDMDGLMGLAVKEIAEEKGLKVISIGGFRKKCACDAFLRAAGPEDFIRLVYHAQFVLTSSFHAAALSIIFNKAFAVVLPRINALRIADLLGTAGIPERVVHTADISKMKEPIDYTKVNPIIRDMREASSVYLLNCLAGFEKGGAPS